MGFFTKSDKDNKEDAKIEKEKSEKKNEKEDVYSKDEEAEIKERLRSLGYL